MTLLQELKRRNVFRVAAAYVVASWLIIQVVETIFPVYGLGDFAIRTVITVLAIAFIPALIFSWVFEITPAGLQREVDIAREHSITRFTGKKIDRIIMVLLALALAYFVFDKFVLDPVEDIKIAESAHQEGRSEALTESYGDKSIAVLPFVNMSSDGEQEYFSDGISEELLNLLARIPELRVISRSSTFSFKGKSISIPEVARSLNVAYVLEGSVRKSDNRIRITAQLIEARSDTHLWSETFDRDLGNIFAIQDEIASIVVDQLKVTLLNEVPRIKKTDPDAYALYLQSAHLLAINSPESLQEGKRLLNRVLSIDPNFIPALTRLYVCYDRMASLGLLSIAEAHRLALEIAERALEIEPNSAEALEINAWYMYKIKNDVDSAATYFQRALAQDPTNTALVGNVSLFISSLGRLDDSIRLAEFQVSRDPANSVAFNNLGIRYRYAGYLDLAEETFLTALKLSPNFAGLYYELGATRIQSGDYSAAMSAFENESISAFSQVGKSMVLHAQGEEGESVQVLNQLIEKYGERIPYYIAQIMAYQGNLDDTFEWLNKAKENGDNALKNLINEPLFVNAHEDVRWLTFLASIGKSPQQLTSVEFEVTLPEM